MGKIEEKKTFKYVITYMLYRHTNVFIKVGKKTYEFVNVCNDNKTAFGGNTIAVLLRYYQYRQNLGLLRKREKRMCIY